MKDSKIRRIITLDVKQGMKMGKGSPVHKISMDGREMK